MNNTHQIFILNKKYRAGCVRFARYFSCVDIE